MSKLANIFKDIMNGLQHADAGEFLMSRQKIDYIDKEFEIETSTAEDTASFAAESVDKRRRVALYLGSQLPAEIVSYVIQTCSNLKHSLSIITFETEGTAQALLEPHQAALAAAGIEMKLVCLTGDPLTRLGSYLRKHPEIAFLACKEKGYLAHRYLNSVHSKNTLPVPVVVVVTKKEAEKELGSDLQQTASRANIA